MFTSSRDSENRGSHMDRMSTVSAETSGSQYFIKTNSTIESMDFEEMESVMWRKVKEEIHGFIYLFTVSL